MTSCLLVSRWLVYARPTSSCGAAIRERHEERFTIANTLYIFDIWQQPLLGRFGR